MRILRNYVLKEVAGPFILSLSIFVFILLIGNLIHTADKIIAKGVSLIDIIKLFGSWIPYLLRYALPMSLLTAILLTFGRFSSENEIVAMRASGVSLYRIMAPVIAIGLVLSLFSVILNNEIIPRAHFASRKILADIAVSNPTGYLEEGAFLHFEDHIISVDKVEGNYLEGIKIFELQPEGPPRTVVAERGQFVPMEDKKAITIKLIDGRSDEPDPDNPNDYYQLQFTTSYITLHMPEVSPSDIKKKPKDMTIKELEAEIANFQKFNLALSDYIKYVVEIHKKISLSFANLAFVIIGLPLAIQTKKSSKSAGFGISLGIIIVYYVLLALGNALAMKETIPAAVGAWMPNIITIAIGLVLIYKTVER